MDNAFARPVEAVLANFDVDTSRGLSDEKIVALRKIHGKNGLSSILSYPLTLKVLS